MKLMTLCNACMMKDICKRHDKLENIFDAIRAAEWPNNRGDRWPLKQVIYFDDDSDGLVFAMDCDDFIQVKENSDVH